MLGSACIVGRYSRNKPAQKNIDRIMRTPFDGPAIGDRLGAAPINLRLVAISKLAEEAAAQEWLLETKISETVLPCLLLRLYSADFK
jgi:hypothetical protein